MAHRKERQVAVEASRARCDHAVFLVAEAFHCGDDAKIRFYGMPCARERAGCANDDCQQIKGQQGKHKYDRLREELDQHNARYDAQPLGKHVTEKQLPRFRLTNKEPRGTDERQDISD
ncbi:hypothetical protein D9M72_600890 [compost metagenome]